MTLDAVISTWVTSQPPGAPYTGVRSWAVSPVLSRLRSLWHASWSMRSWSSATSGTVERRRTPAELRTWAGRQKRGRRTVLAGWDRQARLRALKQGRSVPPQTAR